MTRATAASRVDVRLNTGQLNGLTPVAAVAPRAVLCAHSLCDGALQAPRAKHGQCCVGCGWCSGGGGLTASVVWVGYWAHLGCLLDVSVEEGFMSGAICGWGMRASVECIRGGCARTVLRLQYKDASRAVYACGMRRYRGIRSCTDGDVQCTVHRML